MKQRSENDHDTENVHPPSAMLRDEKTQHAERTSTQNTGAAESKVAGQYKGTMYGTTHQGRILRHQQNLFEQKKEKNTILFRQPQNHHGDNINSPSMILHSQKA